MKFRRTIIPYDPRLKPLARKLRNNSTVSEVLLWNGLKNKQMKGYDFHRQKPLFQYIVDFFCNELLLAIEIDGVSHDYKPDEDEIRQKELEDYGIKFMRFFDADVKRDVNGVLRAIEEWIEEFEGRHIRSNKEHTPNPSQEGNSTSYTDNTSQKGKDFKHTPSPSREGNSTSYTPKSSREGNRTAYTHELSQIKNL